MINSPSYASANHRFVRVVTYPKLTTRSCRDWFPYTIDFAPGPEDGSDATRGTLAGSSLQSGSARNGRVVCLQRRGEFNSPPSLGPSPRSILSKSNSQIETVLMSAYVFQNTRLGRC